MFAFPGRPPAWSRRLVVISVCVLAVVAAGAQAPVQQPPTFRGGIDLVQVDVSVLDKDRKPVTGLTAADFTVRENGRVRPVVTFVPVRLDAPPAPEGPAAWVRDVPADVASNQRRPEGRLVVILFDWSIRFGDQALARRIANAAVDQLGPDDLAAVVFSSAFGGNGTPQNFTADRARLRDAIARPFASALHNPPVGPGHDPRNGNEVMIDDPEGYESGDCLCRACVPETIARLADTVRDVPGRRKILVFIGTYFRSYESLKGPLSKPPAGPPAAVTGIVRRSQFTEACSGPLKDARRKMERATALANLTIHTLDPVGIETSLNSPMGGSLVGMRERQDDLHFPADMTGGRTVLNTEAPEAALPDIFAESGSYYLLGFAPEDPKADGRFRRVEVKVNRPGVTLRTVSGYEPGARPATNRETAAPAAASALLGILPRPDLPLTVTASPFATPGSPSASAAVVVGIRQPAPLDGDRPVTVLTAAFDAQGRAVQSQTQTVGVMWRPDASGTMPYQVLSRLPLKPGRYEVRVAVDGADNARASVYTFVDVPDFVKEKVALSGLVFGTSPPALTAPPDAFSALMPMVPTARRRFSAGDHVSAFLRVYQAKELLPATIETRIVDVSDREVASDDTTLTPDRFAGGLGAGYRLDLPLDRLETGEYLLTIEATAGGRTARRSVRFAYDAAPPRQ
jgi:VWFA-related protein